MLIGGMFVFSSVASAQVVATCEMIGDLYSSQGECRTFCNEGQVALPPLFEQQIEGLAEISDIVACEGGALTCCLAATIEIEGAIEGSTYPTIDQAVLASLAEEEDGVSDGGGASNANTQTIYDPLGGANIPVILGGVIRGFAGIAGSIAFLMFIYGGIMYILSGGEGDKVKKATMILQNASIGIVLIFGAYAIVHSILEAILAD